MQAEQSKFKLLLVQHFSSWASPPASVLIFNFFEMKTEKSLTTLITLAVREKGGEKAKMSIFILLVQSKQHGVLGLGHDRALV